MCGECRTALTELTYWFVPKFEVPTQCRAISGAYVVKDLKISTVSLP